MVSVSAPGNIFFFGEHAVVYGRPAIIAAIGLRTVVDIEKRKDRKVVLKSENYGNVEVELEILLKRTFPDYTHYNSIMDPVLDLVATFCRENGVDFGFDVSIKSDIPKESGGLSSSTAVFCSVFGGLNKLIGKKVNADGFFDCLYPFQVKVHGGAASGSELVSSSIGGFNVVRIDKAVKPARLERENLGKHEYHIVIGDTGIERGTKETVSYVRSGWEKSKKDYEEVFDEIKDIVEEGKNALIKGDVGVVGELMNKDHELLSRDLGVSHPKLNRLVDVAIKAGAHGAKLSGGGKGGMMFALCDRKTQQEIANALARAGARTIITKVGAHGFL